MAKFKGWVSTNKVGSRCEFEFEVPDSDLEGLSEEGVEKLVDDWAFDEMLQHISWNIIEE